jgi:methyl-accepting chemotaxis protein
LEKIWAGMQETTGHAVPTKNPRGQAGGIVGGPLKIGQQIAGIQTATHESVAAIKEIGDTIPSLVRNLRNHRLCGGRAGAATQEIARNVQQAAHCTQQVSANIADVKRGANETGPASSQLFSAAQTLSRDSDRLKHAVAKFLNAVRPA